VQEPVAAKPARPRELTEEEAAILDELKDHTVLAPNAQLSTAWDRTRTMGPDGLPGESDELPF
jgi:hypothetical protein